MIDLLAAVAVLVGAALAVLAGFGLLRFPDAFSRLHAAAKAATIGVIATTLAAALEVDTFGAAALLVLVTAFLFLSAPLGTTLLARAAYLDPATPRIEHVRDDLRHNRPPEAPPAEERDGARTLLIGWLALVWVALFASATPGVAIGALVVGVLVSVALPAYRPRWPEGVLRPVAVVRFAIAFLRSLWLANLEVVRAVLTRRRLQPAVIVYKTRVATQTEMTLLMNTITFTPGSIALEVQGDDIFIHLLDLRDEAVFLEEVRLLELRIIEAFGTRESRARHSGDDPAVHS